MWISNSKNHRNLLLVFLTSVGVTSSVAVTDISGQNIVLSNNTTSTIGTPITPRPTHSSTVESTSSTTWTRPALPSTPTLKPSQSTTRPRPLASPSNASLIWTPTTLSSPKLSPNATKVRNRTPNLDEFLAVAEPQNNDISELNATGKLHLGRHNSTRIKPTSTPNTNTNTAAKSGLNATSSKIPKRTNTQQTRRNPIRRKLNTAKNNTRSNYSNNATLTNATTTKNTTSNNTTKLFSLPSKTFPQGTSSWSIQKIEHEKMCSVGDAIIPATCFSCRCDFNGIFNEWACTKDDLCIWANHNANLAKRGNLRKGVIHKIPTITKKIENSDNVKPQSLGGGNRFEAQRCVRGQFYQDECQYCICAMNGRYQCSDLCSRIGAPIMPQTNEQNNPFYSGHPGQNSNLESGWPSGVNPWTGNYPNYYNAPLNSGGVAYNLPWNWDYPSQRYFDVPQTQMTIQSDKKNITPTVGVKSEVAKFIKSLQT